MFQIISYICLAILFIVFVLIVIGISQYLFWFYFRSCKKCGHHMYYRGLRHNDDGDFFYFHCRHCGNWEKISKEQYLRELGKDINTDYYD
jgi:hypothetical protein